MPQNHAQGGKYINTSINRTILIEEDHTTTTNTFFLISINLQKIHALETLAITRMSSTTI